jgi:hypothetical protein
MDLNELQCRIAIEHSDGGKEAFTDKVLQSKPSL